MNIVLRLKQAQVSNSAMVLGLWLLVRDTLVSTGLIRL